MIIGILKLHFAMCTLISIVMLVGSISFSANAQNQTGVRTYDFNVEDQREQFQSLSLDDDHPNLLNPEISADDIDQVRQSWGSLHQQIGSFLKENQFDWEVEGDDIAIVHKIYFTPEGQMRHYFFRVINEEVTLEKRQEYAQLLMEFSKKHVLDLDREEPYAQCGKTRYANTH